MGADRDTDLNHGPAGKIRLDKWLWFGRFVKSRGLAAKLVSGGHVRVNGDKAAKPSHSVSPGDVLTIALSRKIWVVRIEALGCRRGPAPEAQALYTDLTPAPEPDAPHETPERVGARPTKRDRRVMDAFRDGH